MKTIETECEQRIDAPSTNVINAIITLSHALPTNVASYTPEQARQWVSDHGVTLMRGFSDRSKPLSRADIGTVRTDTALFGLDAETTLRLSECVEYSEREIDIMDAFRGDTCPVEAHITVTLNGIHIVRGRHGDGLYELGVMLRAAARHDG